MPKKQYSLALQQPFMMRLEETSMKGAPKIQDEIKIVIAVWNLEGMIPPHNSIKKFMDSAINDMGQNVPDIICIATQQCQRSINLSFFCENKDEWENAIKQSSLGYQMVESQTMNALHTALLVKNELADCYTTERKSLLRAGLCNLFGNKGAISIVANLLGQNLQFINCHLQAHQHSNERRNQVLIRIADNLVEKDYRNEVFICGDLNYRIEMTHEQYHQLVGSKYNTEEVMNYSKLLDKDQLSNQQILKQLFLPYFKEEKIGFPPTYKISEFSPEYNRSRIPGWTDRIFHRKGRAKQLNYRCLYDLYGTDHRPVLGSFTINTEETLSIFPDEFVVVKKANRGCSLI